MSKQQSRIKVRLILSFSLFPLPDSSSLLSSDEHTFLRHEHLPPSAVHLDSRSLFSLNILVSCSTLPWYSESAYVVFILSLILTAQLMVINRDIHDVVPRIARILHRRSLSLTKTWQSTDLFTEHTHSISTTPSSISSDRYTFEWLHDDGVYSCTVSLRH